MIPMGFDLVRKYFWSWLNSIDRSSRKFLFDEEEKKIFDSNEKQRKDLLILFYFVSFCDQLIFVQSKELGWEIESSFIVSLPSNIFEWSSS